MISSADPSMEIYQALDIQPAESMEALVGDGLKKLQTKGAAAAEAGFSMENMREMNSSYPRCLSLTLRAKY